MSIKLVAICSENMCIQHNIYSDRSDLFTFAASYIQTYIYIYLQTNNSKQKNNNQTIYLCSQISSFDLIVGFRSERESVQERINLLNVDKPEQVGILYKYYFYHNISKACVAVAAKIHRLNNNTAQNTNKYHEQYKLKEKKPFL